jgi:hypothetical protein
LPESLTHLVPSRPAQGKLTKEQKSLLEIAAKTVTVLTAKPVIDL